jgi:DNA-binding transcriptional LysR family regulator
MLDVRRLRVLIEVAERKSFQKAADALSFTQPSVSRHIAALEREAGAPLLDRRRGHIRLTQAGEIAVQHARVVLARLGRAENELRALQNSDAGRLRLGAFASANTWLIPTALARFAVQHPGVDLSLTSGSTLDHPDRLLKGELDLALITEWDHADVARRRGVQLVELVDDPLLLALSPSHGLAQTAAAVRLEDLGAETWIEGPHPDCLGPITELHSVSGFEPRVKFVCEDLVGIQALVSAKLGITLLPRLASPGVRSDITLRDIADDLAPRRVFAAYCAEEYCPPAVAEMIAVLQAVARHQPALPHLRDR